jgi:carbamoyltransferase
MRVLGISPLDKDASASAVEDGRVLFASAEERYSRVKQHAGFPGQAIAAALAATGWTAADVDAVAYPFLDAAREEALIEAAISQALREADGARVDLRPLVLAAADRRDRRDLRRATDAGWTPRAVHGLLQPDQRMVKSLGKRLAHRLLGLGPLSRAAARSAARRWAASAVAAHRHWQGELESGLEGLGLLGKLQRSEHHLSHAANAYLASGHDRALIVTLDGYGSGLAGSVSLGEAGVIKRLAGVPFPHSLGSFYEAVTSSLGYQPDRHAGKIVGLAAYGDPGILGEVLLATTAAPVGELRLHDALNIHLSRHLAGRFAMVDVAAAWQHVLELLACRYVAHWLEHTGCEHLVLSGGVAANVKLNQRLHALPGVRETFVYPNMGDGGCGTGLALLKSWPGGVGAPLGHVYLGPEYGAPELEAALRGAGLAYERVADGARLAEEVARRIHAGQVVARFDGRMEYGPRALGNRSILYHAREAGVNQWLNQRLGRTEFMPFAPVTLWEARERCYAGLAGAEHAAEFMTITFDCTPWMRTHCPAAVHVDGTARPQLLRRETNPGYHDILTAYERLSGIPCLINTSFNMHEEPIVCTPRDAVRAYRQGRLDTLVLGPFVTADADAGASGRDARAGARPRA